MTWILLYIFVGITAVIYLILYAVSQRSLPGGGQHLGNITNLLGLPSAIPFALFILAFFGLVLAVILIASSAGNEYNWRTIRIALISSEGRMKFLGAKLISVIILILLGMVIGLATGFIMSLITTAIGGYSFDFSFFTRTYIWDQFLQFWRTFFIIMVYVSLGFLFAVMGRSAMPGIAVGIGILFLEPVITALMQLAGGWIDNIPEYLFNANVEVINALNQLPSGFGGGGGFGGAASTTTAPSVGHAFIVLSVYMVVCLVISFLLFRKRDLTG
jgi:ABC-2 type transport system permease protein